MHYLFGRQWIRIERDGRPSNLCFDLTLRPIPTHSRKIGSTLQTALPPRILLEL